MKEDKKKGNEKTLAILYSLCAFVWTVKAAIDFFSEAQSSSDKVMSLMLAIVWIMLGVAYVRNYRKSKNKEVEE